LHHHIADSIGPRLDDTEYKRLLSLIYALPSRYDMLDRSWHWHRINTSLTVGAL
jgi:hypothetical protein